MAMIHELLLLMSHLPILPDDSLSFLGRIDFKLAGETGRSECAKDCSWKLGILDLS